MWAPNDSHEGGMLAEMYRSGNWTALTYYREPFLEKPPLLHWTGLILCTIFGQLDAGLIRVPSAMFGFATLLIIWNWGWRLGRGNAGVLAALLCATNILYCEYSRVVSTDVCLTFVVAISLHAFWSAYEAKEARVWRYLLFLLVTSFSFYAKGLIGPAFIMGPVAVFLATRQRWTKICVLTAVFVPLLITAVYPWAAALYRQGGREWLISAFIDNQLGRFFKLPAGASVTALPLVGRWLGFMAERPVPADPYFVHKEPIYYYLIALPKLLLPWTLLVPPALIYWFKRDSSVRSPFASFLRCACATMAAILHFSSSKAGAYVIPLLPIVFLMVGVWCADISSTRTSRIEGAVVSLTSGLVRIGAIALPSAYLVLFALPRFADAACKALLQRLGAPDSFGDPSTLVWAPGRPAAWLGAGLCIAALLLAFRTVRGVSVRFGAGDYGGGIRGLAATLAIVVMLAGTAVMPVYDYQRTYTPIVDLVKTVLAEGYRVALATRDSQVVGEFVFYSGRCLPLVEPILGIRTFLEGGLDARGVVIRRVDLASVESSLQGLDHAVRLIPESAGMNAKEFCLITRPEKTK